MSELRQPRLRREEPTVLLDANPAFTIETRPERERVIVAPQGELDVESSGVLGDEVDGLASRGFGAIVLDLRGLTFMDSSGLRLVIEQTRRTDVRITLIDGAEPVSRIFELTGTRCILPFEAQP
jgi:anti-sigma B factor antagonist